MFLLFFLHVCLRPLISGASICWYDSCERSKYQNKRNEPHPDTLQFGLTKEVNIELCVGRRGGSSFALCEAVR